MGTLGTEQGHAADVIGTLRQEHAIIWRMLKAFEAYAGGVARALWMRKEELASFVEFFRGYVTELHQTEENVLLEALVARGFSRETGPVRNLLTEHDLGRRLMARLACPAFDVAPWTLQDRHGVAEIAQDYGRLMRAHIQKEHGVLFPLVAVGVRAHVLGELNESHRRRAARPEVVRMRLALEASANELIARYEGTGTHRGVPPQWGATHQAVR